MDLFSGSEGSSSSRSGSPELDIIEPEDVGKEAGFTINAEYAARFQHNKQRTELQQLEEKYDNGREGSDESSSEDETEDEEGEQVTADVDAAILTTLAKIRRKDESIYEAGKRVFDEERDLASKSKLFPRKLSREGSSKKKVTLAEYQRSRIQELIKNSNDPAKDLAEATMIQRREDGADADIEEGPLTHTKEQEQLRREVTDAFHSIGDEDGEDFFTKADGANEEDDEILDPESYRKFLLGVLGGKDKEEAVREILRTQTEEASAGDAPDPARGKAPKVRLDDNTEQDNEEFLMNYVLNRGWVENPEAAPKSKKAKSTKAAIVVAKEEENEEGFNDVSSEDSFDSRAEAFENAYNFRFEEMEEGEADTQIQSYARNPVGSVRRKEDKRKKEREERSKRKQEEKEKKRKELDRLRDLKRKSIVDRLKKLKEATGSSNVDFERFQLDDEFDPEEHDKLMQKAFDEEYYGEEGDMKKPKWDDDVDVTDIVEDDDAAVGKKGKKAKSKKADDIEMDSNFMEQDEPIQEKKLSKAEKKKLKKREKAKAKKQGEKENDDEVVEGDEMDADVVITAAQQKEEEMDLDPVKRKERMQEAMNEYYGLEYEDMIGDQPTRFKYTQVPQSSFGLTAEEILLADDEDLKGIVSLNRLQPYREGKKRPSDLNARLKEFRRKYSQNLEKQKEEDEREEKSKTKRMGKKERQRRKEAAENAAQAAIEEGEADLAKPKKKKSKTS